MKRFPLRPNCNLQIFVSFVTSYVCILFVTITSSDIYAKGLEQISNQNPTNQPPATPVPESGVPQPASALSQGLAGQVFVATSTGFVSASKSSGSWKTSGGASDFLVGYKVMSLNGQIPLFGTYRYAPIAVTGTEKSHEYRGIWETHHVGALAKYSLTPDLEGLGGAELGYTLIYLRPTDKKEQKKEAEENGIAFTLLGGLEYKMLENRLTVGPRLHLGFGVTTVYQLAASAGFYF